MKNILFVPSSPRGWESYSHRVARRIVDDLKARDPETRVIVRDRHYVPSHAYYGPPTVIVRERTSSVGPALAGFVGGLVLGSVISHGGSYHDDAPAQSSYYYDPYCEERFGSLDACYSHYIGHQCDHPLVVEVIDARSGRCTGEYLYRDGDWHTYQGDFRDGGDYRDRDHRDRGDDDDGDD